MMSQFAAPKYEHSLVAQTTTEDKHVVGEYDITIYKSGIIPQISSASTTTVTEVTDSPPPVYVSETPTNNIPDVTKTPLDPASRLQIFGSPYAHDSTWAPHSLDTSYTILPSLPIQVQVSQSLNSKLPSTPCPSFTRQPPNLPPAGFPTIVIPSKGNTLSFTPLYPGRFLVPRDISLADWARFLQEVEIAGRVRGSGGVAIKGALPIIGLLGPPAHTVKKLTEREIVKRKRGGVWGVLEDWEGFFGARGVRVEMRENGVGQGVVGINQPIAPGFILGDRAGGREMKREMKMMRREEKFLRREGRREARFKKREFGSFCLIVSPIGV